MKRFSTLLLLLMASAVAFTSCVSIDQDMNSKKSQKIGFDITVTRDGQPIPQERIVTRGGMVDAEDYIATMNPNRPFGLIGIEKESGAIVIENEAVHQSGGSYSMSLDPNSWSLPRPITFSAYYPHIEGVAYGAGNTTYSLTFGVSETDAGPLVSQTVEKYISQINMLPLEFRHITNDIGYKICDVTPNKDLQGLMHLRELRAVNVASAGVYVNDLEKGLGRWSFSGYYRTVTVFTGNERIGVGSENERFVGSTTLVEHMKESHRYYAVPDELVPGKQYVEVVFDVDGFTLNGFYYGPLKNQVRKYMLYGLLEDNVGAPGKQYTFHIGVDLTSIYKEIVFSATITDWETTIYENNDDF